MTKAQKQRIKELAEQDCEVRHVYCTPDGKTCVIGKLLKEIGYDLDSLPRSAMITAIPDAITALEKDYGLDNAQCYSLQNANDGPINLMYEDDPIENRRARVLKVLDEIPTTD